MATYLHPGVYLEEIPSGVKPIEGVSTSVAAFVGYAVRGPLGVPTRIAKYDDYADLFGGIRDTGSAAQGDPMGQGVFAFFQNGGTAAYIVRITRNWENDTARSTAGETKDAVKASGVMDHPSPANTTHGLRLTAVNEGTWANGLVVKVAASEAVASRYVVEVGRKDDKGRFAATERFADLSTDTADARYLVGVLNSSSLLVDAAVVPLAEIQIPQTDLFRGSSTSGSLTGVDLDFSEFSAADRRITLALDATTAVTITVPAEDFTGNLAGLAAAIQAEVRSGAQAERRTGFTCTVRDGNRLVLTSGTRTPTSSVVVTDEGLAETLKLGVGNEGATEVTGQQSADAVWTGTSASALNEATLTGGADGSLPAAADYGSVFDAFLKIRDISILSLPGQAWAKDGSGSAALSAAISHAETMKNRMVLVDPPPDLDEELSTEKMVNDLQLPTSTYSVLYYPWVKVANPFYNAETRPTVPRQVLVPPGPLAAGMWSKIDGRRGVWKAPAGVETGLLGVAGLQYVAEDPEQDVLNPLGVNCLRALPSFGPVIWGSRTLSTKAAPEWRYVPVRRTAIMIEQSIYGGIQWAVFEPNDHRLWASLRLNIESFMNGLFRAGAFQGEKASDAYFVRCGLGDTMTQGDIDRGQVIVIVGFAPLKPAEFVIVRIQQKVGQE